jgi:hypothetical protein
MIKDVVMKHTDKPVCAVQTVLDRIDDYHLQPEKYLNKNYGRGSWQYDPYTRVYIVRDDLHDGPGRGFVIVRPDLSSVEWVLPPHHVI